MEANYVNIIKDLLDDRLTKTDDSIQSLDESLNKRIQSLSDYVGKELEEIKKEVKLTNGRVTSLEEVNRHCPIFQVQDDIKKINRNTQFLQMLAERPKLIVAIVAVLAILAGLPNWLTLFGIEF